MIYKTNSDYALTKELNNFNSTYEFYRTILDYQLRTTYFTFTKDKPATHSVPGSVCSLFLSVRYPHQLHKTCVFVEKYLCNGTVSTSYNTSV